MTHKSLSIVKGSILDVTQSNNKSDLAVHLAMNVEVAVCCDSSGSMDAGSADRHLSRREAQNEQLARIQQKYPGKVAVYSWGDRVEFCPAGVPTEQGGGTDMAAMLDFIASDIEPLGISVILISDGSPDSESLAMSAARNIRSPISTIYIGPERGPGQAFLERLARATGGKAVTDFGVSGNFETSVSGLLPSGMK